MKNVIVLSFKGPEEAVEAQRRLRGLHENGDVELDGSAVVERTQGGKTVVLDLAEEPHVTATAAGGVVGGLVGLLAGPLGALAGGATGALVGSLVDVADVENTDRILRRFGDVVPAGSTATIAAVVEESPAAVDGLAAELGVTVLRRPRAEVEREVAEAEESVLTGRRDTAEQRTVGDRLKDLRDALSDRR